MKAKANELVGGIMAQQLSRKLSRKLMEFMEPAAHLAKFGGFTMRLV